LSAPATPQASIAASRVSVSEGPRHVVVDFAVIDRHVAAARRFHRLVAGRGQVDDGEAVVGERDSGFGIAPDRIVVRPAMADAAGHALEQRSRLARLAGHRPAQKSCKSAHMAT